MKKLTTYLTLMMTLLMFLLVESSANAQTIIVLDGNDTRFDIFVYKNGEPYYTDDLEITTLGWQKWWHGLEGVGFTYLNDNAEIWRTPTVQIKTESTETVDYWENRFTGEIVYGQTMTGRVYSQRLSWWECHLKPTPPPISAADYPRANTPAGGAAIWGPKSMLGGAVYPSTGEFWESVTDMHVIGRGLDLVWARRYLSGSGVDSDIGNKWDHSYNIEVKMTGLYNDPLILNLGSGRKVRFEWVDKWDGEFDYYEAPGWPIRLRRNFGPEIYTAEEIEADPSLADEVFGVVRALFPDGTEWVFIESTLEHPKTLRLSRIEDANGNKITFTYVDTDSDPLTDEVLETITDTLSRDYTITYYPIDDEFERDGMIQSFSDFSGRIITYDYYPKANANDQYNDLKSVEYPASLKYPAPEDRKIIYTYYDKSNLETIIDPRGNDIVTNIYDEDNVKVIEQYFPHNGSISITNYAYATHDAPNNKKHPLTVINDGVGNVQVYFFNEENQLTERRDYTGRATYTTMETTFNPNNGNFSANGPGTQLRSTDPESYIYKFEWNEHDNLTKSTAPDGLEVSYDYEDDSDNILARGAVKTIIQTATGGEGTITTQNAYDTLDDGRLFLDIYTDAAQYTTDYDYDDVGNLTTITRPETTHVDESFTYNEEGQLLTHTLPSSKTASESPIPRMLSYAYNSEGFLESITEGSLSTSFTYFPDDPVGTVESTTDPEGNTWNYTYDINDDLLTSKSPPPGNGNNTRYTTKYEHNKNGAVEKVLLVNAGANNSGDPQDIVTKYVYDEANRVKEIIQDDGTDPSNLNLATHYEFDANGQTIVTRTPMANKDPQDTSKNYKIFTEYDEQGGVFKTNAYGRPDNQIDYNINGLVERTEIGVGTSSPRITSRDYDGFSRGQSVTTPNTTVSKVDSYDPRGLPDNNLVNGRKRPDLEADVIESNGLLNNPSYIYDGRGRTTKVFAGTDIKGTEAFYTDSNQVHKVIDPDNLQVTYDYDSLHRLKEVKDSKGNSTSYTYDDNSNVTSKIQTDVSSIPGAPPQIFTTIYEYDDLNRLTKMIVPGRIAVQYDKFYTYEYDSRGNRVKTIEPNKNWTKHTFDNLSRIKTTERSDASSTNIVTTGQTWDDNSRIVTRTDPKGKVTTYFYNALGYNFKITYGDGGIHTFTYDDFGNVIEENDPNGNIIHAWYDNMNRLWAKESLTAENDMEPIYEYYYYDGQSRLIFAANQNTSVHYSYNTTGTLTDPNQLPWVKETVTVQADISLTKADIESEEAYFQTAFSKHPAWHVVAREYTHAGRINRLAYPSGRVIKYNYQNDGLLDTIEEVITGDTIADYSYIGGRLEQLTLGSNLRMSVGYDEDVHGTHITGITYTKNFNNIDPELPQPVDIEKWEFDYDGSYNKTKRHDTIRDKKHTYEYDELNRMKQSYLNLVPSVTYTLDDSGNRDYDLNDLQVPGTLHTYSNSPKGPLEYDFNGNLDNIPQEFTRFSYDVLNEMVAGWDFGNVLQDTYSQTITGDYTILSGDFTADAGYLEVDDPDLGGHIINTAVPADLDQVTFSFLSRYDPADASLFSPEHYATFLMKVEEKGDTEWAYLSLVIEPQKLVLNKWDDDVVSTLATYDVPLMEDPDEVFPDPLPEPPPEPTMIPSGHLQDVWYDIQVVFSGTNNEHIQIFYGIHGGEMTSIIDESSGLTNSETDVAFTVGKQGGYLFDNLRIQADSITAESMQTENYYDVFGRRVGRTTYANYIANTTYFAYDGDRVIEQWNADDYMETSFVYGGIYIDEVLQMYSDPDGDGTYTQYFYLRDDLFNILALTDSEGTIVERYEYGDFGKPTIYDANNNLLEDSNLGNPYFFNGRRYDFENELYWYRTRYMDPELGRFISRDTIGLWGDAANLGNPYSYLNNNPWSGLDPYGLEGEDEEGGILDSIANWFSTDAGDDISEETKNVYLNLDNHWNNEDYNNRQVAGEYHFNSGRMELRNIQSPSVALAISLNESAQSTADSMQAIIEISTIPISGPAGVVIHGGMTVYQVQQAGLTGEVLAGIVLYKVGGKTYKKFARRASSRRLRNNLIKLGDKVEDGMQAHHIVPGGDGRFPSAVRARELLLKHGIDIDSALNGVFLPGYKYSGTSKAMLHSLTYTQAYSRAIEKRLSIAKSREHALKILQQIKKELLGGTFDF